MNNQIEEVKLDNGLTIYLYLDTKKHSTYVGLTTKFGGATKDFYLDGKEYHVPEGIAHLLEHYVVEQNSVGDYVDILGKMQLSTNASTGAFRTMYYFSGVEQIEEAIPILLKSCYSPIFTNKRLEEVKKAIYQEVCMCQDRVFQRFHHKTLDQLFTNISFRETIGSLESVKAITLKDVKACYQAFYQPKNQILVVAGNFKRNKILEIIKKCYKDIKVTPHDVSLIKANEPLEVKEKDGEITLPTEQPFVDVSYKVDLSSFSNKERVRLTFYLNYFLRMAFGRTSKTYQELVKNKIITGGVNYGAFEIENFLVVSIGGYTDQKEDFVKAIKKTIKKQDFFDEEFFELCKKQTLTSLILRNESLTDTIIPFIDNIVMYDYHYPDTIEEAEEYSFKEFKDWISKLDFTHDTITYMKK